MSIVFQRPPTVLTIRVTPAQLPPFSRAQRDRKITRPAVGCHRSLKDQDGTSQHEGQETIVEGSVKCLSLQLVPDKNSERARYDRCKMSSTGNGFRWRGRTTKMRPDTAGQRLNSQDHPRCGDVFITAVTHEMSFACWRRDEPGEIRHRFSVKGDGCTVTPWIHNSTTTTCKCVGGPWKAEK